MRDEVLTELERVIESPAMSNSRRCQDFLRYVVRLTLDGRAEQIKERTIAQEVFGRGDDFEPSEDSAVRVKAGELRKRLQRHYEREGACTAVRIQLPLGSYVPVFQVEPGEAAAPRPLTRRRWLPAALAGAAASSAAVFWATRTSPLEDFWRPVLESGKPLLICLPSLPALHLVRGAPAGETRGPDGLPRFRMPEAEFTRRKDHVGRGAAHAAACFAAVCGRFRHPFQVKVGDEVDFTDLRHQPSVLLGAFSWKRNVEMNRGFRFTLVQTPSGGSIEDSRQPGRVWRNPTYRLDGTAETDVALVVRARHPETGHFLLAAAGISTFGTQAAAEFMTRAESLQTLAASAPRGWTSGSLQAVIANRIIDSTPGPPKVLATHFWNGNA